jgi:hypothetical protein
MSIFSRLIRRNDASALTPEVQESLLRAILDDETVT